MNHHLLQFVLWEFWNLLVFWRVILFQMQRAFSRMRILSKSFILCAVQVHSQISCNSLPGVNSPCKTDYKWCRENIKDYIAVPDCKSEDWILSQKVQDKQEEIQNPTRGKIDVKEDWHSNLGFISSNHSKNQLSDHYQIGIIIYEDILIFRGPW